MQNMKMIKNEKQEMNFFNKHQQRFDELVCGFIFNDFELTNDCRAMSKTHLTTFVNDLKEFSLSITIC